METPMKAMILAAGLGQRMRPLTDHCPKPLLTVGGKPLLAYHLERLHEAGFVQVVINLAYLGEKISDWLGDGSRFGLEVQYSFEEQPLETGGGIARALPLLGNEPFVLLNGDVWTDYPLVLLAERQSELAQHKKLGHLVMVPNPVHHPDGDFVVCEGRAMLKADAPQAMPSQTFSGISILSPALFEKCEHLLPRFPLRDVLFPAIRHDLVSAECYAGPWCDVGTPERLASLDVALGGSVEYPDPV